MRLPWISASLRRACPLLLYILGLAVRASSDGFAQDPSKIAQMGIEELMNLDVTSVSRGSEKLADAPAAIYVITQEQIRRSGMRSIPDVLRMVPGLEVAQIGVNRWAISSRGFNQQFSNKMLALIDGRSLYLAADSGVSWDTQDTLLEDIERIEIIRGPGPQCGEPTP